MSAADRFAGMTNEERIEAVAREAGVSVDDVHTLLRILYDNGGEMDTEDLERVWTEATGRSLPRFNA